MKCQRTEKCTGSSRWLEKFNLVRARVVEKTKITISRHLQEAGLRYKN